MEPSGTSVATHPKVLSVIISISTHLTNFLFYLITIIIAFRPGLLLMVSASFLSPFLPTFLCFFLQLLLPTSVKGFVFSECLPILLGPYSATSLLLFLFLSLQKELCKKCLNSTSDWRSHHKMLCQHLLVPLYGANIADSEASSLYGLIASLLRGWIPVARNPLTRCSGKTDSWNKEDRRAGKSCFVILLACIVSLYSFTFLRQTHLRGPNTATSNGCIR